MGGGWLIVNNWRQCRFPLFHFRKFWSPRRDNEIRNMISTSGEKNFDSKSDRRYAKVRWDHPREGRGRRWVCSCVIGVVQRWECWGGDRGHPMSHISLVTLWQLLRYASSSCLLPFLASPCGNFHVLPRTFLPTLSSLLLFPPTPGWSQSSCVVKVKKGRNWSINLMSATSVMNRLLWTLELVLLFSVSICDFRTDMWGLISQSRGSLFYGLVNESHRRFSQKEYLKEFF